MVEMVVANPNMAHKAVGAGEGVIWVLMTRIIQQQEAREVSAVMVTIEIVWEDVEIQEEEVLAALACRADAAGAEAIGNLN
jgi:hypothetical protein